jgi:hypothetical protein
MMSPRDAARVIAAEGERRADRLVEILGTTFLGVSPIGRG